MSCTMRPRQEESVRGPREIDLTGKRVPRRFEQEVEWNSKCHDM